MSVEIENTARNRKARKVRFVELGSEKKKKVIIEERDNRIQYSCFSYS